MKVNFRTIIFLVLLVVMLVVMAVLFGGGNTRAEQIESYAELLEKFESETERVTYFELDTQGNLNLTTRPVVLGADGKPVLDEKGFYTLEQAKGKEKNYTFVLVFDFQIEQVNELAARPEIAAYLTDYNYKEQGTSWFSWLLSFLPTILLVVCLVIFWIVMMNQAGGKGGRNSFARSHAKVSVGDKNSVKFIDVAGADEEKAELQEVVEFLKNPDKFVRLGARIPRGILLVGPPGTGKTLLAKAVAGEAGVPFFSISGSDFVEMYVGVGASRVRDLFDSARKSPASIIFIDEIDAVGRQRGAGLGGGHDEREQTLNQLLVEMDGFGTHEGIIVIAATNRPDILDAALLRPGRFDRQITVNYPDMKGREAILHVHARNKPLEGDVDFSKIAKTTVGFTGADLANLMNEAALLAARRGKSLIGMEEIDDAFLRVVLGPQKKSKARRDEDIKLAAYHEAGHAVVAYYCKHADPVTHITIIPSGQTGGVTVYAPKEDRMGATKGQMADRIVSALGGRAAEQLVLDDISTGASNDIQQATSVARSMVTRYGMSNKLGTVLYGSEHSDAEVFLGRDFAAGKNYSEATAAMIDEEIKNLIDASYTNALTILKEHMDKLVFVAEYLIKYETMDGKQFEAAMQDGATEEAIQAMEKQRRERSTQENMTAQAEAEQQMQAVPENVADPEVAPLPPIEAEPPTQETNGSPLPPAEQGPSDNGDDDVFRF